MSCSHPDVPKYLHYEKDKRRYSPDAFKNWHIVYRIGNDTLQNPIVFSGPLSSFSMCWSKLIKPKHILKTILAQNPNLGNAVYYGKVKQINNIAITENCNTGDYQGTHSIRAVLKHTPQSCNYSHCEIQLDYSYPFKGENQSEVFGYDSWVKCPLSSKVGKPPAFFKSLKGRYQAIIYTILNNKLPAQLPWYSRILPQRILIWVMLFLSLHTKNIFTKSKS